MQLFKLGLIFGLASMATAGYHHGHASSYASVVKHEDSHPIHHGGGGGGGGYDHGGYAHSYGHGGHGGHDDSHDYYAHPAYKFDYGVKDSHTGDNKNQWEHRDGDHVKGAYMLHEPDGTTRIVEYTSDKHAGFNAVVKRVGHAHHPQIYGHDDHHSHGHEYAHGHGHAESYANSNLHSHHH